MHAVIGTMNRAMVKCKQPVLHPVNVVTRLNLQLNWSVNYWKIAGHNIIVRIIITIIDYIDILSINLKLALI